LAGTVCCRWFSRRNSRTCIFGYFKNLWSDYGGDSILAISVERRPKYV